MITLKRVVSLLPSIIVVGVVGYWIYFKFWKFPLLEDLSVIDDSNRDTVGMAVEQITNANEFLVSLLTALFGVCGFFLNKHKSQLSFAPLAVVYLLCLILLGLAYYSAFKVYTSLVNSICQNAIAIVPGSSKCLFYIEEEFILAGGTSIVLLSILIAIFINSTKIKLN